MQVKAAVISLGSTSSGWIADALRSYFDEVDELSLKAFEVFLGAKDSLFYEGNPLKHYDCIYARGSYKYATLLNAITTILHKETYFPLAPSAHTLAHDKLLAHFRFIDMKVPTPKTFLASTPDAGKRLLDRISYPLVIKMPAGTHGKGVMFADSKESASSMIDALDLLQQPILMQEYIDTQGVDIRAIVVGDKVVASMNRKAKKGENRANFHLGGSVAPTSLDDATEKIAISAARALGCEICAADILLGAKGPVILEVNASPGLQGITKATQINVADIIAKYLHKRTKEFISQNSNQAVNELVPTTEVLAHIQFKGSRILLPQFVSETFKAVDNEEVTMKCSDKRIIIKRIETKK